MPLVSSVNGLDRQTVVRRTFDPQTLSGAVSNQHSGAARQHSIIIDPPELMHATPRTRCLAETRPESDIIAFSEPGEDNGR